MRDLLPADRIPTAEPLVRLTDLAEYRQGLERHLAGELDDEKWTAYRIRFGIYGQRQPGVQMVRIKVPGGVVPTPWLKVLARVNREFAVGDAHITTRQDVQIYSVALSRSADLLEALYSEGITTREACGNTVRNLTSCALAGSCPRELVDAGKVAEQLATSWIRHPLVQHMPRKVKITVSGCGTDCGGSSIHDLAFVAVEKDGRKGFKVTAGGGLGSQPRAAIEVLPFATEEELPATIEALARIHHRYSDRRNRNAARIKFVAKRFGEEKFRNVFVEEFERVKGLAQRPWSPLSWRQPIEAPVARTPVGIVPSQDGRTAVVAFVPLGILSSDQLDGLHDIAVAAGVTQLRTTRDQNLALLDVPAAKIDGVVAALRSIGLDVPEKADEVADVISCPGTTTCRIGITNSQNFARHVAAEAKNDVTARGTSVHVSGCQNSCGLHHIADFGLHGMAKKIDNRSAPHYQLHIGGDKHTGAIGITGPLIPARLADKAVKLLRNDYAANRQNGESVRGWAERLGKDGIAALLAPIEGADADGLFVDWGDTAVYAGAPTARGECAAPMVNDSLLADLADDALIDLDRNLAAGRETDARANGHLAVVLAGRRLLNTKGHPTEDDVAEGTVFAALNDLNDLDVSEALAAVVDAGTNESFREAVAYFLDTIRDLIENPAPAATIGGLDVLVGGFE